jgi:hypothetical protein
MKIINSNKKCLLFKNGDFYTKNEIPGAWVEAYKSVWWLEDISPVKSLAEEVYEYFKSKQVEPWPAEQAFLRLTCGYCNRITIYNDKIDLPLAFGAVGCLVCPHCQAPWLFYEYGKM